VFPAPLRQLKNIPKVFHICPVYIVKATTFYVKIYSSSEFTLLPKIIPPRQRKTAPADWLSGRSKGQIGDHLISGRESSSSIHSFCTSTTRYSVGVSRMTMRLMPALMIRRRHMEQEVEWGISSPFLGLRQAM